MLLVVTPDARSPGRRGEAVAPNDVGLPGRSRQLEAVRVSERAELRDLDLAGSCEVGDVTEEALEPCRADDLDHAGSHRAGIPHGVQLPAWLGDVAPRAEHYLAIPRAKADLPLGDDRVLVFARVQVRGHIG